MAEIAALKDQFSKTETKSENLIPEDTLSPELVIAFCSPIGTPVHQVVKVLESILINNFSYECHTIKLSDYIKELAEIDKNPPKEFERRKLYIEKGDLLREQICTTVLAEKAIHEINRFREDHFKKQKKLNRFAFIIDSIKNQNELDLLKFIYRDECYCIGAFAPLSLRLQELTNLGMTKQEATTLVELDSGLYVPKDKRDFSQTVQKTFPQSDLFVRLGSNNKDVLKGKLERFAHLIFGSDVITPTPDEAAMFAAASAAVNSGCLSRQVGACITDRKGNIISVGWNDVPSPGGGLYRCDSPEDLRCGKTITGECHNSKEKETIIDDIIKNLDKDVSETVRKKISDVLKGSQISSLIEFSRAIHAEMFAVIQAGKLNGALIEGGNLYCTTYPCHNCARHLVAAGIVNIYYIEPFAKSLAVKLHFDSLTENEDPNEKSKVRILAFDGVAPNRFLEFFQQNQRKDRSPVKNYEARPRYQMTLEAIPLLEQLIVKNLIKKLEKIMKENKSISASINKSESVQVELNFSFKANEPKRAIKVLNFEEHRKKKSDKEYYRKVEQSVQMLIEKYN